MQEVIRRRVRSGGELPDLFLIDGGKGQVMAVWSVLSSHKIHVPVVGLAKKFETLIYPQENGYHEIRLPVTSPARKLVQRIRDESHRFAQRYHHLLRRKSLITENR